MKKIAIAMVAALVAASAFAAAQWVGDSYIIINGQWYNASGQGNAEFSNIDVYGDSFALSGTIDIYDENGQDWGGGDWDAMHYAWDIDQSENWADINMKYSGISPASTVNMRATADETPVDISSWAIGESHTLSIYFGPIDGQYDSGNNFSATVTKTIPEPATMSLLGLGALAMVIRRKLSK